MKKLSVKLGLVLLIALVSGWACRPTPTPPAAKEETVPTATSVNTPSPTPPTQASLDPNRERSKQELLMDSLIANANVLGNANAPVTILEFSDFKCPHCANFATDTLVGIRENYVDTGLVRLAFKHITTLGPESVRAAEAGECAAEQEQFWTYHDRVFANQAARGSSLNDEQLQKIAQNMGLDTAAFSECLASGRHLDTIKAQLEEAESLGIQATPGFIINGETLIGAQPLETFTQFIEAELRELGIKGQPKTGIEQLIVYPNDPAPLEVLDAQWQNCGIYDEPVEIDPVLGALAHGAVWISYPANIAPEQLNTLKELVIQAKTKRENPMIILAPTVSPVGPITATAWRVQLLVSDPADPRLSQFVDRYQLGPFTPEPGEPCSGGVGQPID